MKEKELIKKIKELDVSPDKEWVGLTKARILEKGAKEEMVVSEPLLSKVSSFLSTPIKRPALAVTPLVLIAAILGGLFVYFNFIPQAPTVTVLEGSIDDKEVVASLSTLQEELSGIRSKLESIGERDPKRALSVAEVVKAAAREGEKAVVEMREEDGSRSREVLATLDGVEEAYRELGEEAGNTQIALLTELIDELSSRELTVENQRRLQRVVEYYNEGKYNEAIVLIQKIEVE